MKYSLRDLFELAYYDVKNFYDQPLDDNNRDAFKAFVENLFVKLISFVYNFSVLKIRRIYC